MEVYYKGQEYHEVILWLVSYSIIMDLDKHDKSYQNIKASYAQIAEQIAKTAKASMLIHAGDDVQIGRPLIQYGETDWEFLKRIASHVNQQLIVSHITAMPEISFGVNDNLVQEIVYVEKYQECLSE